MEKLNAKIVVVWPNFGPHHVTRLSALSRYVTHIAGIEISRKQMIYPWHSDKSDLPFSFYSLFDKPYETVDPNVLTRELIKIISQINPQIIVMPGLTEKHYRKVAAWARKNNRAVVMSMATWAGDKKRFWVKEWVKSFIYRRYADAVVCTGIRTQLYTESLGFSADQIWRSGNALADEHYYDAKDSSGQADTAIINEAEKLPEHFFIYVGRFSAEKNLQRLISAYEKYVSGGGQWGLVLVGDGPQKKDLQNLIVASPHAEMVVMVNWLPPATLKQLLAQASCFILPSIKETWGLVAQEAMLRKLPILISRKCGCLPEFCVRGVNGYDFDPLDVHSLSDLMCRISHDKNLQTMGIQSRKIAERYTPDMWAKTYADCFNTVLGSNSS